MAVIGAIDANSSADIADTLTLSKSSGTGLAVTSNATVGGTLGVTGASVLTGSLTANGGIICDTDKFVVADGTGNTTIGGTLGVAGKSNFSEDVSFNKNVTIQGNLTVEQYSNTAIINTTTTNYTLIVAEDLSLNGRMFISEDISLNKDLFVGDKSILHGDVSMNSRVDIGGDVSMNKQLQVAGGIIGNVTGNVTGSVATVSAAAQPAITSVGTLTSLAVDNISLDSNTISASTGALNLTPAAGSALVLDGAINVDAGVVTCLLYTSDAADE